MRINVIWKYIDGYEGIYIISNKGIIKNIISKKVGVLKKSNSNSYKTVTLVKDGNKKK